MKGLRAIREKALRLGLGFIVGGAYCGTLAALGREAITRLSGGAL